MGDASVIDTGAGAVGVVAHVGEVAWLGNKNCCENPFGDLVIPIEAVGEGRINPDDNPSEAGDVNVGCGGLAKALGVSGFS